MEFFGAELNMWLTFGVIIAAITMYTFDRIPLEISSIATVAALLLLFHVFPVTNTLGENILTPRDLLKGFSDPALITILALLVVGQGLVQTGALNVPARLLVTKGEKIPKSIFLITFVIVMFTSAVLNNTPVIVIFIPILAVLCEKLGRKTSHMMMPLSFVAILGGNLTLIGSSTNLLVAGSYFEATGKEINFFDFTVPGLVLATVGLLYIALVIPRILPDRAGMAKRLSKGRGKQFIFQIEISNDNALAGHTAVAGLFPGLKDVTIRMIQRGQEKMLPPYDDITLSQGDIVQVATTRKVMTELLDADPYLATSVDISDTEHKNTLEGSQIIAEAVVAPASRMDGRTLAQTGFRSETACAVLGVQRRSRMIRASLGKLRLEAGDVLLIMGSRSHVMQLRNNPDVILMDWSATERPQTQFALRAQLIFAALVALAATGILPIVVAALIAAVAMVSSSCLNVRQAARAFDRRVYAIVGSALALGASLSATGGALWIAEHMLYLLSGAENWIILSGFFLMVALLTNILSNNATAVLFTPVGLSIADHIGVDPFIFVIATIFAANCSFATPMSYQTNLLVMAPGHYKFIDYVKAGTPLIFILWLTFTFFAMWYYNL